MMKPIPSVRNYFADEDGNIWSTKPGRWGRFVGNPRKLSLNPDKGGYLCVVVHVECDDGVVRKRNKRVASLVAEAFHGPRPDGLSIAHLNGIKTDNRPSNLSYETYKVQALHKERHGTMVRGDRSRLSVYTDETWMQILRGLAAGQSQASLSRKYGPSLSAIHGVRTGKFRRHLTMDTTLEQKASA